MNICRRGDELLATAGREVDATSLRLRGSGGSVRTRGIKQGLMVWLDSRQVRRALTVSLGN